MEIFDIVIVTEDQYIDPKEVNGTVQNVLDEDIFIQTALEKKGLIVSRKAWSDYNYDWSNTRYAIFRSNWDYYYRFDDFIRWLGKAQRVTNLLNPFKLIQWNLDKHYLIDLKNKGIPTVPTTFIRPLTKITLSEILESNQWVNAVLKPSISGSARHTYKIQPHNMANHEPIFGRLIKEESLMVQPFLENITTKGEIGMVFIDGKFTHAVQKKAKFGEFRVQDNFGGTVEPFHPDHEQIELATKAIDACPLLPLYARVDMVWDNDNNLVITELELIEPELFFRFNPDAANLLADSIIDNMK